MDKDDAVQPYWSGGPFHVALVYQRGSFSPEAVATAVAVLEEFRGECQKAYFAFNGAVNGRLDALIKYQQLTRRREARFSVGTAFPDGEQRPGKSTIAVLTQGEHLDSLAEGGDFEDRQNKAFMVMLYHRWDEWYRHRISRALGLRKKEDVRCTLMGELRLLRNLIVHENAIIPQGFSVPLLSRIWGGIATSHIVITDRMIHALMEQLNAMRVEAGDLG